MLKACLHENSFCPKMSLKLTLVVWSYQVVILKLWHCNSIAVFFYFHLSKHESYKPLQWWLLNFWIIINFQFYEKQIIILCVKNYLLKIIEDVTIAILQSIAVNFFLVKHNSIFEAGYCNRKNIFPFTDLLSLIFSKKKILRKKTLDNFETVFSITSW